MNTTDLESNENDTDGDLIVDGRTARRQRNKDAVLDAMIALAMEGNDEPSVEAIAERAGVSYRSVYRYFTDRTDLMLSAIARLMGELWPIFDIKDLGAGALDDRIEAITAVRLTSYHKMAPLTRSAMRRRVNNPAVADGYDRVREYLRDQLAQQFQPELAALAPGEREMALVALDTMFQFEALDYMANCDGVTDTELTQILARHVRAHLGTSSKR
jgi:AcrR family transcriptional regulator